jgi:hypothetical protein
MSDLIQRTPEWYAVRLGKATASRMGDMTAKTKNGWGASRANYMAELVLERLTGKATDGYTSAAMQFGIDNEAEARATYEFMTDQPVVEIGFLPHPTIGMAGCSPDGLIGAMGLVEIKVPNPATHLDTLLGAPIDERYIKQAMFQMACSDTAWCDFVSYRPDFPESMRLFVQRIPRNNEMIKALEFMTIEFLTEVDAKVASLTSRFAQKAAA